MTQDDKTTGTTERRVDPKLLDYLEANLEVTPYRQTPGRADEPASGARLPVGGRAAHLDRDRGLAGVQADPYAWLGAVRSAFAGSRLL